MLIQASAEFLFQSFEDAPVAASILQSNAQPVFPQTFKRTAITQKHTVMTFNPFTQRDQALLSANQEKIDRRRH